VREVIIETIGKGTRIVLIGRESRKKSRKNKEKLLILSFVGITCSPRTFPRTGSDAVTPKSRSWKTTKKGEPHAKKGYQRHPDRQPSRRRNRWGRVRKSHYPSARTLNELGLCIYPNIGRR